MRAQKRSGEAMENKAFAQKEKEAIILKDICFARMRVMHAGEILAPEELPIHSQMSMIAARQVMKVTDSSWRPERHVLHPDIGRNRSRSHAR